jgi:NAD(P)-dependent dehydrogenase (short-subunit alcohol dehydrogenase family)
LITGASQGLGREIARTCVREGANVLLCARNDNALRELGSELRGGTEQRVLVQTLDVRNESQVDAAFSRASTEFGHLDGVVNNAGIWGPKGPVGDVSWKEWRAAIETNLFGVVLCCRAGLPLLGAARRGKIVNLSGGGATAPTPFVSAYAASKAAVVRFTETLAGEIAESGIDVNALAPGALNTSMLDEILDAGADKVGTAMYERALKQKAEGGASLERAAQCCAFLLSNESDGITGRLISAVWDPWPSLPAHRGEIAKSDVYTLRRIVPRDRGLPWG